MIPWLFVDLIGSIAYRVGYSCFVRAKSGSWGAERIYFVKLRGDEVRLPKLKPAARS